MCYLVMFAEKGLFSKQNCCAVCWCLRKGAIFRQKCCAVCWCLQKGGYLKKMCAIFWCFLQTANNCFRCFEMFWANIQTNVPTSYQREKGAIFKVKYNAICWCFPKGGYFQTKLLCYLAVFAERGLFSK